MTRSAFYLCLAGLSGKLYGVKQYKIGPKENVQITITRIRTAIYTMLRKTPTRRSRGLHGDAWPVL